MPIIAATEISSIAFSTPIDPALILDEIINAVETKFIIPAITKPVYDDLSIHPGIYSTLIADYIMPYLAYCVKLLLYSQYQLEISTYSSLNMQRDDIANEINKIIQTKKDILINHLSTGIYPLYISSAKKRISGFLIK